jgi:putative colanic acid biosynthesis glycosyltransferase
MKWLRRQEPPFISVITVTRDNLDGLKNTGRSVSLQSGHNHEWIVVDGGSVDGSADYLKATPARWISEIDSGIYDAMNKGLRMARGAYVIFMNAGDIFADSDTLSRVKIALAHTSARPDFIYGDAIEDGHYKDAKPHHTLAQGMFTHHQAMFYRRAHKSGLLYDTAYEIAADYDFTCRFLMDGADVLYMPRPICVFETGGISQRLVTKARKEQAAIRKAHGLCGPVRNAAIQSRQIIAWALRSGAAPLFWRMKSAQKRRS